MRDLFTRLLSPSIPAPCDSVVEHWRRHVAGTSELERTIDQAIVGGVIADRPAYAFASGYEAALHALVPSLGRATLASLCVTEEGGGHPRAIHAKLEGGRLEGGKRWSTMAPVADVLFIAASAGQDGDKKLLRLVRVERGRAGVTIEPMPDTQFVPEVPHARVTLKNVAVDDADVLPGDGWEGYVKAFRTVEDLHVTAALTAHVFQAAVRYGFPDDLRARLWATLALLRSLAGESPRDPAAHIALAGALSDVRRLLDDAKPAWARVPAEIRERWERDRAIMSVAEAVRAKRTEIAWAAMR